MFWVRLNEIPYDMRNSFRTLILNFCHIYIFPEVHFQSCLIYYIQSFYLNRELFYSGRIICASPYLKRASTENAFPQYFHQNNKPSLNSTACNWLFRISKLSSRLRCVVSKSMSLAAVNIWRNIWWCMHWCMHI